MDEQDVPRERKQRVRAPLREVKMEVLGTLGDPAHHARCDAMVEWRNRLVPLLRLFFTTVNADLCREFSAPNPTEQTIFVRRQSPLSINTEPIPLCSEAMPNVSDPAVEARQLVDEFMRTTFFSKKFSIPQLLLRPYFSEPRRAVSYLLADTSTGAAVLVDPDHVYRDNYLADLQRFNLSLSYVVETHSPFDTLRAEFPGVPKLNADLTLGAGSSLCLVAHPTPGYSPEARCFLLKHNDEMIGVFTGPTLGTDCVGRCDLAEDGRRTCTEEEVKARAVQLFASLRPLIEQFVDNTVLFPGYSGYGHTNTALDLTWASHWADLKRNTANEKFVKSLRNEQVFVQFVVDNALDATLPLPFLFVRCRALNTGKSDRSRALAIEPSGAAAVFCQVLRTAEHLSAVIDLGRPFVVDLRSTEQYCQQRIVGSVSIPLSFPIDRREAKKAELWMSSLLHPEQQHYFIVDDTLNVGACAARVESCGFDMEKCFFVHRNEIPEGCWWSSSPWSRVESYADMEIVGTSNVSKTPASSATVYDCRTTYEFRNGSHTHCYHLPLADLRRLALSLYGLGRVGWTEEEFLHVEPQEFLHVEPHTRKTVEELLEAARLRHLIVYCAGGYRSHIATSLLKTLSRAVSLLGGIDDEEEPHVSDLAGGALQLMTKRPDLWSVKDRSIICIS